MKLFQKKTKKTLVFMRKQARIQFKSEKKVKNGK